MALGPKRNVILVAVIAILLVVSGALVFGIKLETVPFTPLERAMADLRVTPLLGLVMKDYPDSEKAIRAAVVRRGNLRADEEVGHASSDRGRCGNAASDRIG